MHHNAAFLLKMSLQPAGLSWRKIQGRFNISRRTNSGEHITAMPQQRHGTSAAALLWRITYQILRQSRPFLRRWTASSSGWSSPPRRRRRPLPPAAARLAAIEAPRDKGQHSAATADNTACRQTSIVEWCYTSSSLLSISIPALLRRKETPAVSEHCRDKALYGFRALLAGRWVDQKC